MAAKLRDESLISNKIEQNAGIFKIKLNADYTKS